jgi:pimeloyl-ACP methyl ester carboxylesterase
MEGYIDHMSSRFRYRVMGQGPLLTVCFHGFGESADHFAHLSERLPDHTLVAIDMPFHGKTEWNEPDRLTVPELVRIVSECPPLAGRAFGVMGYSMGGKMALSLVQSYPAPVTHLCLIAADGLRFDPWHWFCTRTLLGKRLLERMVEDPSRVLAMLRLFERAGWVNPSSYKFVTYHLKDPVLRRMVHGTWISLRDFTPDTDEVLRQVRSHAIPVCMVYGHYDRLAPRKQGEKFYNNLGDQGWMKTVESGHMLLSDRNAGDTAAAVSDFLRDAKPRSG